MPYACVAQLRRIKSLAGFFKFVSLNVQSGFTLLKFN